MDYGLKLSTEDTFTLGNLELDAAQYTENINSSNLRFLTIGGMVVSRYSICYLVPAIDFDTANVVVKTNLNEELYLHVEGGLDAEQLSDALNVMENAFVEIGCAVIKSDIILNVLPFSPKQLKKK